MQDKYFFNKIFSDKRMRRYFESHDNEQIAILHYQCNIELAASFYSCLSVYEIALRNALNRELIIMTGREDWSAQFTNTVGLSHLNRYITQANKQILNRKELSSPSKIVAELTLGFWVSLLNSEYERVLWKDLRRAFPYMPKELRQRKNISAPLNKFRAFRNRVFHHEPICWNLEVVMGIHNEMIQMMGWINKDIPAWVLTFDRVSEVVESIRKRMSLENK